MNEEPDSINLVEKTPYPTSQIIVEVKNKGSFSSPAIESIKETIALAISKGSYEEQNFLSNSIESKYLFTSTKIEFQYVDPFNEEIFETGIISEYSTHINKKHENFNSTPVCGNVANLSKSVHTKELIIKTHFYKSTENSSDSIIQTNINSPNKDNYSSIVFETITKAVTKPDNKEILDQSSSFENLINTPEKTDQDHANSHNGEDYLNLTKTTPESALIMKTETPYQKTEFITISKAYFWLNFSTNIYISYEKYIFTIYDKTSNYIINTDTDYPIREPASSKPDIKTTKYITITNNAGSYLESTSTAIAETYSLFTIPSNKQELFGEDTTSLVNENYNESTSSSNTEMPQKNSSFNSNFENSPESTTSTITNKVYKMVVSSRLQETAKKYNSVNKINVTNYKSNSFLYEETSTKFDLSINYGYPSAVFSTTTKHRKSIFISNSIRKSSSFDGNIISTEYTVSTSTISSIKKSNPFVDIEPVIDTTSLGGRRHSTKESTCSVNDEPSRGVINPTGTKYTKEYSTISKENGTKTKPITSTGTNNSNREFQFSNDIETYPHSSLSTNIINSNYIFSSSTAFDTSTELFIISNKSYSLKEHSSYTEGTNMAGSSTSSDTVSLTKESQAYENVELVTESTNYAITKIYTQNPKTKNGIETNIEDAFSWNGGYLKKETKSSAILENISSSSAYINNSNPFKKSTSTFDYKSETKSTALTIKYNSKNESNYAKISTKTESTSSENNHWAEKTKSDVDDTHSVELSMSTDIDESNLWSDYSVIIEAATLTDTRNLNRESIISIVENGHTKSNTLSIGKKSTKEFTSSGRNGASIELLSSPSTINSIEDFIPSAVVESVKESVSKKNNIYSVEGSLSSKYETALEFTSTKSISNSNEKSDSSEYDETSSIIPTATDNSYYIDKSSEKEETTNQTVTPSYISISVEAPESFKKNRLKNESSSLTDKKSPNREAETIGGDEDSAESSAPNYPNNSNYDSYSSIEVESTIKFKSIADKNSLKYESVVTADVKTEILLDILTDKSYLMTEPASYVIVEETLKSDYSVKYDYSLLESKSSLQSINITETHLSTITGDTYKEHLSDPLFQNNKHLSANESTGIYLLNVFSTDATILTDFK
ncbi:hypothetical protein AYI68_g4116, partial [Smittium mucronatum]